MLDRPAKVRENYHMLDDEFQLPILEARYLADSDGPGRPEARRSCSKRRARRRRRGSRCMFRELALVAAETRPYARDPTPTNLVSFVKRDSTHWRSASWRDSDAGYANGRFAMDINAIWAPQGARGHRDILARAPRASASAARRSDSLAPESRAGPLGELPGRSDHPPPGDRHLEGRPPPFRGRRSAPRGDRSGASAAKLAWLPASERAYWRKAMTEQGELGDSLTFLALSLDSAGAPIPVVNTDPATELFLGRARHRPADRCRCWPSEPFLAPIPSACSSGGSGRVVANDAYADAPACGTPSRRTPTTRRGSSGVAR